MPNTSELIVNASDTMSGDVNNEPQPDDVLVSDAEVIQRALVNYLKDGHTRAVTLSQGEKKEWVKYARMAAGKVDKDDPQNRAQEIGVYQPIIEMMRQTLKAAYVTELLANPGMMDFFKLRPEWYGVDRYAEGVEKLCQKKFRDMAPADAPQGFLRLFDMWMDDFTGPCGNCIGTVTHEQMGGDSDNEEMFRSGPTGQWFDPFNVWPWDIDVNSFGQTNTSIYQPLTLGNLKHEAYGFVNLDNVFLHPD